MKSSKQLVGRLPTKVLKCLWLMTLFQLAFPKNGETAHVDTIYDHLDSNDLDLVYEVDGECRDPGMACLPWLEDECCNGLCCKMVDHTYAFTCTVCSSQIDDPKPPKSHAITKKANTGAGEIASLGEMVGEDKKLWKQNTVVYE